MRWKLRGDVPVNGEVMLMSYRYHSGDVGSHGSADWVDVIRSTRGTVSLSLMQVLGALKLVDRRYLPWSAEL